MSTKCSVDAYTSTQTLSGPLSESLLNSIGVNDVPFYTSFAPRTIAPKLEKGGQILEPFGNTIQINNVTFEVLSVKIMAPIHKGFIVPGQSYPDHVGEILIIVINHSAEKINSVCIPIYSTQNTSSYSAYLDQLYDPTKPVANLQTIFKNDEKDDAQKCIKYTFCESGKNIEVFVFPLGIQIPSTNWQKLLNIIGQLSPVVPPPGIVSPVSKDFQTRFQYFKHTIGLVGKFDSASCPAYKKKYKTSEYKCVPFDRIRNLDGDTVVFNGANTLSDRLRAQDEAKKRAVVSVSGEKPGMDAGTIAAIVCGSLVGGVILVYIGSKTAQALNSE